MSSKNQLNDSCAASGVLQRDFLLDDLLCSICFEYLNNPKTLPCQHTFCNACLERK